MAVSLSPLEVVLPALVAVEYLELFAPEDPEIRQGVKEYSNWPTVPQLYVKGEFVGGSDIMINSRRLILGTRYQTLKMMSDIRTSEKSAFSVGFY